MRKSKSTPSTYINPSLKALELSDVDDSIKDMLVISTAELKLYGNFLLYLSGSVRYVISWLR